MSKAPPAKNEHAVALGRLGGLKGGLARKQALSPRKRSQIASKAAQARWDKRDALVAMVVEVAAHDTPANEEKSRGS